MFTIGDFATFGRVSVRMLRHYDAIGLLRPAAVDPSSGYRYYEAAQLPRLNRIIALKDLGLTLEQVAEILDGRLGTAELRGMLLLRRTQVEAQVAADVQRLAALRARLRMIDQEGVMSTDDVVLKQVPATRVAVASATAASYEPDDITPVVTPLFDRLMTAVGDEGLVVTGPPIALYEAQPDGEAVTVRACFTVAEDSVSTERVQVIDLPALASAATIVHRGPMDDVEPTMELLAAWIEEHGYRPLGFARELYVDYYPDDAANGVTELQIPVERATVGASPGSTGGSTTPE
jgi:DNA-binding transcriptional MerR regulator